MKFKVGDWVRKVVQHRQDRFNEGLGIVLEIQTGNYAQIKVATAQGITYWWPAVVTEVVDESR